ncbi:MAG: hypothetical protein ACFFE4_17915 [Candidatus Thorarchaeota archaeon]
MKLYTVYENGVLRKVNKVDFKAEKVYLIDDIKILYLWFGSRSSEKKKEFGIKRAAEIKKNRTSSVRIETLNQNQEFGSFLIIMDILKKGVKQEDLTKLRGELVLEPEDTQELIDAGLKIDLEAEITLKAHNLSQAGISYEDLSRQLAKLQLILLKGKSEPSTTEIKKKTEEILKSSTTYEELCWLVSELEILTEKKKIE